MQIEIIDNSGLVRKDLEAACLRALEKCGLTAEEHAKSCVRWIQVISAAVSHTGSNHPKQRCTSETQANAPLM